MKTFKDKLEEMNACPEAIDWVGDKTLKQAWDQCERGDWMMWLAKRCAARLVEHLMTHERSLKALDVADGFSKGKATEHNLKEAAAAAYHAAYAAYDAAYDAGDAYDDADAYHAAYAAYGAVNAVNADRDDALKKCADICREMITVEEISKNLNTQTNK